MKTLYREINEFHLNSRRIQKIKMCAVLEAATLDKKLQFFSRRLCMKETVEEDNFVSTRPHISNLFFFMRLTTSCCLRGLFSPLTFQQQIFMMREWWEVPRHCQMTYWFSFALSSW
jgi:hypothetical protein